MTRRMAILVAVVGLMVMAFAGTALAVVKVGNADPNRLVGTAENDTLKGRSGADTIIGKGDSDRLYGGRGADHTNARERGRAEEDLVDCGRGPRYGTDRQHDRGQDLGELRGRKEKVRIHQKGSARRKPTRAGASKGRPRP